MDDTNRIELYRGKTPTADDLALVSWYLDLPDDMRSWVDAQVDFFTVALPLGHKGALWLTYRVGAFLAEHRLQSRDMRTLAAACEAMRQREGRTKRWVDWRGYGYGG